MLRQYLGIILTEMLEEAYGMLNAAAWESDSATRRIGHTSRFPLSAICPGLGKA
jgi:hypothetical protein